MKCLCQILFLLGSVRMVNAQQTYITKGKIEYEKVINVNKVLEENFSNDNNNIWLEAYKKTAPKTSSSFFDLYFSGEKSLYKPGREVITTQKPPDWVNGPAIDNIVYKDLANQLMVSQKHIYEDTYLIKDSTRLLKWKISSDTRTIAGLECRKATTIIMDSVFVVAFFTEQVLCTSGPEGFDGLPGMILGLAIPRLHTTWYATKLELLDIKDSDMEVPKKGKNITNKKLKQELEPVFKDWGKNASKNLWQIMI